MFEFLKKKEETPTPVDQVKKKSTKETAVITDRGQIKVLLGKEADEYSKNKKVNNISAPKEDFKHISSLEHDIKETFLKAMSKNDFLSYEMKYSNAIKDIKEEYSDTENIDRIAENIIFSINPDEARLAVEKSKTIDIERVKELSKKIITKREVNKKNGTIL